ncbi:unnamed protein product [Rotaria sordida]|uniref:UBC core domain-containing protein n=1 Tax=Rotaria sordida TaxID=392033 RepID=A0A814VQU1_9BILA|nr:unnamed protein product [Rotaria sordida]CAF1185073.1 unnamed protein product [Rotaria sordida]CAF1188726.1 unnamed protein product [Rotaria sordida]
MTSTSKLDKALWTNITRLKLLTKLDAPVKFIFERSPFDDEQDEECPTVRDEYLIIGKILPESDIFKQGAFQIEMKLIPTYPIQPPEVRFITPIYHPNIAEDGKFCYQLLNNASKWKEGTTLVEVVKTIVKHVDNPDADYAANYGKEYMENRPEFNRKALEMVKKHALPRNAFRILLFVYQQNRHTFLFLAILASTEKQMATVQLNKELYNNITRLKLLNATNSDPKFVLEKSPFDEDNVEAAASANTKEIFITGRIFPESEIFREGAFQIEMKVTPSFPFDPPEVRFLTKIYHPNVAEDGKFCHELLKKHAKWTNKASLVDVVKAVVQHIDKPDIDYSLSLQLGREYMENRPEFNRKALEYVKKHALPRS